MRPLLLSVALLCTIVASAQFTRKSYSFGGNTIWFYEYRTPGLPASYKYTTIISLGGVGQQGDGSLQSMQDHLAEDGLPLLVKNGMTLKFNINGQDHGFLLLVPQLSLSYSQWQDFYTDGMIDYATKYTNFNPGVLTDPNKIFLTGFSLGGGGCWKYLTSSLAQASKLAGVIPCYASDDGNHSNLCLTQQGKVAVWAFHSDGDQLISSNVTRTYINQINSCNPLILPARATIFPDGAHGGWNDRVYSDTTDKWHNPNIYEWMLGVSRTIDANNNQFPVNNARIKRLTDLGQNLTLTVPVRTGDIILDGSTSFDPDDIISEYQWTRISGPTTYFTNYAIDGNGHATSEQPVATIVNAPNGYSDWMDLGTYTYRLTVKDYKSQTVSVNVNLTVQLPASGNALPGAYIEDKIIYAPATSVGYGVLEKDWDGTIAQRQWRQVSGPSTLTFSNPQGNGTNVDGFVAAGTYQIEYKVTDNQGGVGSHIATVTKLGVLPVTFSYFKGKSFNGHNVLSWATTSEINNDRFELQRSTDGASFNAIGTIAAKANAGGSEYSYDDAPAPGGTAYYRLKQIDKDGRATLSKVVRLNNSDRAIAIEKYPNPANSILTVTVEGNTSKTIGVAIADMQGRIVKQYQWNKENLLIRKDISIGDLQNGLYQLIVSFGDGRKDVSGFVKY